MAIDGVNWRIFNLRSPETGVHCGLELRGLIATWAKRRSVLLISCHRRFKADLRSGQIWGEKKEERESNLEVRELEPTGKGSNSRGPICEP